MMMYTCRTETTEILEKVKNIIEKSNIEIHSNAAHNYMCLAKRRLRKLLEIENNHVEYISVLRDFMYLEMKFEAKFGVLADKEVL